MLDVHITPDGQTTVQTKGITETACRQASRAIEQTLGHATAESLTSDWGAGLPNKLLAVWGARRALSNREFTHRMHHLIILKRVREEAVRWPQKCKNPRVSRGFRGHGRDRIRTCEGISHQIYSPRE